MLRLVLTLGIGSCLLLGCGESPMDADTGPGIDAGSDGGVADAGFDAAIDGGTGDDALFRRSPFVPVVSDCASKPTLAGHRWPAQCSSDDDAELADAHPSFDEVDGGDAPTGNY